MLCGVSHRFFFWSRSGYPPSNAVTISFAGLEAPQRVGQLAQRF